MPNNILQQNTNLRLQLLQGDEEVEATEKPTQDPRYLLNRTSREVRLTLTTFLIIFLCLKRIKRPKISLVSNMFW